jgi:acetylglutamate kinase
VDASLLVDLMRIGCVPIIASVGVTRDGSLLNVNADTLAAHLAVSIHADRLILAGATAGVLDAQGATITSLTADRIGEMTRSGGAHSGMIAKLAACTYALEGGVADVRIVSGRATEDYEDAPGTRIVGADELRGPIRTSVNSSI